MVGTRWTRPVPVLVPLSDPPESDPELAATPVSGDPPENRDDASPPRAHRRQDGERGGGS